MIKDYSAAFKACQQTAAKGDSLAQFNLGLMYGLGLGVAQSYGDAVQWYRQAAMSNHHTAQCNLGFMYGTGRGVPQDYVQAYAWYNLAAAGGEELARKNRDAVARTMSASQLERAQALSADLFHRIGAAGET